jgi:hypothetical protein
MYTIQAVPGRHTFDTLVEVLTHDDAPFADIVRHLHLLQEVGRHLLQGVLRPLGEPINGARIHQAGKHPQLVAKSCSNGRHGQHYVQVPPHIGQEYGEEVHKGCLSNVLAAGVYVLEWGLVFRNRIRWDPLIFDWPSGSGFVITCRESGSIF